MPQRGFELVFSLSLDTQSSRKWQSQSRSKSSNQLGELHIRRVPSQVVIADDNRLTVLGVKLGRSKVEYEGGATFLTWSRMLKVACLKLLGYKAHQSCVDEQL